MDRSAAVRVVAIDLGASSGRLSLASFDGETLRLDEVHRFPNDPVRLGDGLYWNLLQLYREIGHGLAAAHRASPTRFQGIGIDGWGLDFGLLDQSGGLLTIPRHYRDPRTQGLVEAVDQLMPRHELYARTGIQVMPINTLYQLVSMTKREPAVLEAARTFLMIPDLLRYILAGDCTAEYTNATTTQCLSIADGDWDRDLLRRLAVPVDIFPPIVRAPAVGSSVRRSVAAEFDIPEVPVLVVGTHDTASAVAAVPAAGEFAYLSCGTWSLLGTEISQPILDEQARSWNFTNEGGLDGTFRLLKNIMGLWLVDRCRRDLATDGVPLPHDEVIAEAEASRPFAALIDPDALDFLDPPSMPAAIAAWLEATGQTPPATRGALFRCVYESLALKYRLVLERTERLTDRHFAGLHLVGGGAHNRLLCQFTADAIGRPVWAGPTEATSLGNAVAQLRALGHVADMEEGRALIGRSFPTVTYEPAGGEAWDEAYAQFQRLIDARPEGMLEKGQR